MSRDWEVAIIVDPNCDPGTVSALASNMAVWIVDTLGNAVAIGEAWLQKRSCTSFKVADPEDRNSSLLCIFDTIELHHPLVTLINGVGLEDSEPLTNQLAALGFVPARGSWSEAVAFRRLQIDWTNAQTLHLDARRWKTRDDVFDAFFAALKSPSWHGRNFNALNDSIMTGQINEIEPPFRLILEGIENATDEARAFTDDLVRLFNEFHERGCPVSISAESRN